MLISLGPGSASGKKDKKQAMAKKKKKIGERSGPRGIYRSARLARRYFFYLTPFFAFFLTAEPGLRLYANVIIFGSDEGSRIL